MSSHKQHNCTRAILHRRRCHWHPAPCSGAQRAEPPTPTTPRRAWPWRPELSPRRPGRPPDGQRTAH
eukprot:8714153-Alexandrium_andersonii.AAC.1